MESMKHVPFLEKKRIVLMTKICWMLQAFLFCLHPALDAYDLPVFYKTPYFQGRSQEKPKNWMTACNVRYGFGSTRTSRDVNGTKRPLLSVYDSVNLLTLGVNVDNPGTQTKILWNTASPATGFLS